nr:ORF2 [Torque teno felis virus]QYD01955.1 ORF2 [Torque teno felis virus]QYD01997.1 ORF2 [Torque teno felis virus]
MDPEAERKKLHCAIWLQSCSRTHALWCDCPVWTSHIRGWHPTGGDGDVEADTGAGDSVKIDAFGNLVDAAGKDAEDG